MADTRTNAIAGFSECEEIAVQGWPSARNDEPAIVFGNLLATGLLQDLLEQDFAGACLSAAETRRVRAQLQTAIARGGLQGQETEWTKRELHRVLHAFNQAKSTKLETLYVCTDTIRPGADDVSDPEALNRHERAHFAQRRLGGSDDKGHAGDPAALLENPIAQKAAAVLVRDFRYRDEPHNLAAEIGAHLAEGAIGVGRMGLTTEEGAALAELYFGALVERHGNAVYHLRSLTTILGRIHERDIRIYAEAPTCQSGEPAQRSGAARHAAALG